MNGGFPGQVESGRNDQVVLAAEALGVLDEVGTLEVGKWADMFIFDADTIGPGGTRYEPKALAGAAGRYVAKASGIAATIVNGVPIVVDGELADALPGQWVAPGGQF